MYDFSSYIVVAYMVIQNFTEDIQPYIRSISHHPPLTEEQIAVLHKKHIAGCAESKELLILSNLRLVVSVARKYQGMGVPLIDLISEGNLGLIKGVEKYDPAKGRLSTYAMWWIKQSIRRSLSNQSRTIRLPVHMVEKVNRVRKTVAELTLTLDRTPLPPEIAKSCGLNEEQVERCLATVGYTTSLNATASSDDGSEGAEIGDSIADVDAVNPAERCEQVQMFKHLAEIMQILSPRERKVISDRFGLGSNSGVTLECIGRNSGVTRERIRQIETVALRKLRKQMAAKCKSVDLMRLLGELPRSHKKN